MALRGRTVRVNTNSKNLFGTIIYDSGYKLLRIKLIEPLLISSNPGSIIELTLENKEATFHNLEKQYGISCNCCLLDDDNKLLVDLGAVVVAID